MGAYQAALRLRPGWPSAAAGFALLLATSDDAGVRNPAQAVALAVQASADTGGGDVLILRALAIAYAAAGRFDEATAAAAHAAALAEAAGQVELLRDLVERVARYRMSRP